MTCDTLAPLLVGYHLGALELPDRDLADAHLLSCRACLAAYLSTKRALEDGQLGDELPSPAVRARIRDDVQELVRPRVVRLRPAWILGGAAAAAALFLFAFELGAGHLRLGHRAAQATDDSTLIDAAQADTSLKVL